MASLMSRLSLNQKLALVTFVLGAVALFASPYRGATVTVDATALLADVATGADQVAPSDLAAWILGGRADFRLIDIRSDAAFAQSRIPTAEHIPASGLLDAGLLRNETIILCGDDGTQSAQAWLLLRASGYRGARLLKGGMAAWHDQIVSPVLVENPTADEKASNAKATAIAAYFGGQPRGASVAVGVSAESAEPVAPATAVAVGFSRPTMPNVTPPSPPAATTKAAPKKKKEGC